MCTDLLCCKPAQHSNRCVKYLAVCLVPQVLEEDNQDLEQRLLMAEEALNKLQMKLSASESARYALHRPGCLMPAG